MHCYETISCAFIPHATSGVHLHVLACQSLFHAPGSTTTACIMMKYLWLLYPFSMLFTQVEYLCTSANAAAHYYKHICSLSLLRSRKCVLLVIMDPSLGFSHLKKNLSGHRLHPYHCINDYQIPSVSTDYG